MFINLIAHDIMPGFIELRRPRLLPMHGKPFMYFFRKDTLLSNSIIFTKFDLQYMSQKCS